MIKPARVLALPLVVLAVCGVLAGLARLGVEWVMPVAARWAAWHGVLMASCLMGAVISLERAVAYKRLAGYFAPGAALAAALVLLAGAPAVLAALLLACAALCLIGVSIRLWRLQPQLHGALLVLAAGFWLLGDLLWLMTKDPFAGVTDWLLFLVLTVAAERLELSRYQPMTRRARHAFYGLMAWMIVSGLIQMFFPAPANRLMGLGLALLAWWLLGNDVARRTWKMGGSTRYIASCLLTGYVWLLVAGVLGLLGAFDPGHPWHDAALHAITLGFVFSMIFGHVLIILPAVAGMRVNYHPALYLLLAGLHATLVWRLVACLAGQWEWMAQAGQANALCLLAFVLSLVLLTRRMRQHRTR
jgi:hypothetical protein